MKTNTPDQTKAIKILAAAAAREQASTYRCRSFPRFSPGYTTTAAYVREFLHVPACFSGGCQDSAREGTGHLNLAALGERLAPFYVGEQVTAD